MCAENTICDLGGLGFFRNYLRVRGEYVISVTCSTTTWELPPRARRIRTTTLVRRVTRGTISACAENTPPGCSSGSGVRNYLRVRGEYMYRSIAKPN